MQCKSPLPPVLIPEDLLIVPGGVSKNPNKRTCDVVMHCFVFSSDSVLRYTLYDELLTISVFFFFNKDLIPVLLKTLLGFCNTSIPVHVKMFVAFFC